MTLVTISQFASLTSYLGLAGAATVLRSNPRTLAIIAATGFVFDLIQANTRRRPDEFHEDIEMGHRMPHRHAAAAYPDHFGFGGAGGGALAGGAGAAGRAAHDYGEDWSDADSVPSPRRPMPGRAAYAVRAPAFEDEEEPGKLAKLANIISTLFHSVCRGVSWGSEKISLRKTFAYHYATTFYRLTRNFYAGVFPREDFFRGDV